MGSLFPLGLEPDHPDYALMQRLEEAILRHAGGLDRFRADIPPLLRQAIDEVIDTARSRRFTLDEIEKTEKTYIGTKIEILLRNHLEMSKGKILDLSIDGIEVDIKNTVTGSSWTIPQEAMGHPCILLRTQESKALCWFGLVKIRDSILNPGKNRDGKRGISKAGLAHVHWLLKGAPYPRNFWLTLDPAVRSQITIPKGGTARAESLFRLVQERPIPRSVIDGLGHQHDPMKRLRRNGGARDKLAQDGVAILWGKKDRGLIQKLHLPPCTADEFISYRPTSPEDIALLRQAKHID